MQKQPYVFYLDRTEMPHLQINGTAQVRRIEWGAPDYPDFGMHLGESIWQITVLEGEVQFDGSYVQDCGEFWEIYHYGGPRQLSTLHYSFGGHTAYHGSVITEWRELQRLLGNSEAA
jgi:hypothetical protein